MNITLNAHLQAMDRGNPQPRDRDSHRSNRFDKILLEPTALPPDRPELRLDQLHRHQLLERQLLKPNSQLGMMSVSGTIPNAERRRVDQQILVLWAKLLNSLSDKHNVELTR